MKQPEDRIKRYLLGQLSATDQTAFEDEYILDPAKYEQICQAEDELIRSYTRGRLAPDDRARFESAYMVNPQRRRHVKFDKAFAQALGSANPIGTRQISWWPRFKDLFYGHSFALKLTFTLGTLLIASGGIWLAIVTSRLHTQITEAQKEVEAEQQLMKTQAQKIANIENQAHIVANEHKVLQNQLQSIKGKRSNQYAPAFIIFPLTMGVVRDVDQEPKSLVIPPGIENIRLLVNLSGAKFLRYWVRLLTVDGKEVFSKRGLRSRPTKSSDSLMMNIPARMFSIGDNIVSVNGIASTGEVEIISKIIIKVQKQ
jgi:hypothetical protein